MNKKKNPKIKILAVPNITSLLPPQPPTTHVHIKKHAFAWVIIYRASRWCLRSGMSTAEVDKDITDHKPKELCENSH